jgi:hypothetical protein
MDCGFIITELRLTAKNLLPAKISFKHGLNVITGPTNTGKSYIFQCINYMLGSSTPPKDIKEARGYEHIFLEIINYKNEYFTLESDLKGGNFKLYNYPIDLINSNEKYELLNRKHSPSNENTISAFLLKQNLLFGKKVRTNANGKTRNISYRDIIHFLMVNEERIITQDSPIVSHYTKATEELNILKFITTGYDDSSIVESLKVNEILNRKGKIELLNELIIDLKGQLSGFDSIEQIEQTIIKVENNIIDLNNQHQALSEEYSIIEKERYNYNTELNIKKSEYKILNELLKRSIILNEQYNNDIERLKSTIETSILLSDNHNHSVTKYCPLCNNQLTDSCNEEDIKQIINSCNEEIYKIKNLNFELSESVKLMNNEIFDLKTEIDIIEIKIFRLSDELKNGVGGKLENILININKLNNRKSELLGIKGLQNQYLNYTKQKESLDSSISDYSNKNQFVKISTSSNTELSNKIKAVLEGCNYPEINSVSYSEDKNDFIISGEDRSLSGKGYRAITYAAYIVGLQELISKKPYRLGVPILDSPFVTYKKPKANGEEISIDLAMDFYRYLANNDKFNQFIIIENEEPPVDIIDKIEHIIFTGKDNFNRTGFIPKTPSH